LSVKLLRKIGGTIAIPVSGHMLEISIS